MNEMEEVIERLSVAGLKLHEKPHVALVLSSLLKTFNTLTTALDSRMDDELTLDPVKTKLIDKVTKQQRECRKQTNDLESDTKADQRNRIIKGEQVAVVILTGGLFCIKEPYNAMKINDNTDTPNHQDVWHKKLSHRDNDAVQELIKKKLSTGVLLEGCGA